MVIDNVQLHILHVNYSVIRNTPLLFWLSTQCLLNGSHQDGFNFEYFLNKSFDDGDKSSLNYAYEFLFSKSTSQCPQLRNQLLTVVHFFHECKLCHGNSTHQSHQMNN